MDNLPSIIRAEAERQTDEDMAVVVGRAQGQTPSRTHTHLLSERQQHEVDLPGAPTPEPYRTGAYTTRQSRVQAASADTSLGITARSINPSGHIVQDGQGEAEKVEGPTMVEANGMPTHVVRPRTKSSSALDGTTTTNGSPPIAQSLSAQGEGLPSINSTPIPGVAAMYQRQLLSKPLPSADQIDLPKELAIDPVFSRFTQVRITVVY